MENKLYSPFNLSIPGRKDCPECDGSGIIVPNEVTGPMWCACTGYKRMNGFERAREKARKHTLHS